MNSEFTHKDPVYQNFMFGMAQKVAKLWIPLLLLSKTPLQSKFKWGENQKYRFLGKNRHFSYFGTLNLLLNDVFWPKYDFFSKNRVIFGTLP